MTRKILGSDRSFDPTITVNPDYLRPVRGQDRGVRHLQSHSRGCTRISGFWGIPNSNPETLHVHYDQHQNYSLEPGREGRQHFLPDVKGAPLSSISPNKKQNPILPPEDFTAKIEKQRIHREGGGEGGCPYQKSICPNLIFLEITNFHSMIFLFSNFFGRSLGLPTKSVAAYLEGKWDQLNQCQDAPNA